MVKPLKVKGRDEVLMKILRFSDIPPWPHLTKSCVLFLRSH